MGKYCSLTLLKQYLIGSVVDPANPTRFNGNVINTPDDNILTDAISDAETTFELEAGMSYDEQTYALTQSHQTWIDQNGWVNLFARERGPVTAVSTVQVRDLLSSDRSWKPITWNADDIILPAFSLSDTHPLPESWRVQIIPTVALPSRATGTVLARWSYTGGFATIPDSLALLIAAAATYVYKRRESSLGIVQNQQLGTFSRPLDFPPDILRRFKLWSPIYG
jgi:hypothetical protein